MPTNHRTARATLWMAAVLGALSGMYCERPGWKCGTYLHGNSDEIRRCNREDEVCICSHYSCAVRVPKDTCVSEYLYVDDDYALESLQGTCVAKGPDADSALDQRKEAVLCPGAGGPEQATGSSTAEEASTGTGTTTMTTGTNSDT